MEQGGKAGFQSLAEVLTHDYRDTSLGEEHAEHPSGYRASAAVGLGWGSCPWPLHTGSFKGKGKISLKKNSFRQD